MSDAKEWCASHTMERRTKGRSQVMRNVTLSNGCFKSSNLTLGLIITTTITTTMMTTTEMERSTTPEAEGGEGIATGAGTGTMTPTTTTSRWTIPTRTRGKIRNLFIPNRVKRQFSGRLITNCFNWCMRKALKQNSIRLSIHEMVFIFNSEPVVENKLQYMYLYPWND